MDAVPTSILNRSLEDYWRALKRSWLLILVAALAGGAVGALLAQRKTTSAVGQIVVPIIDESGAVDSAELSPELVDIKLPTAFAAIVKSNLDDLAADTPAGVDLGVRGDDRPRELTISYSGGPDAPQHANDLLGAFRAHMIDRARSRYDGAARVQRRKAEELTTRMQDLDAQLQGLAASSEVARDSLIAVRLELAEEGIKAQGNAAALEALSSETTGGLGEARQVPPTRSSSSTKVLAVIGLLVGGFLAAMVVLARTATDRRIRSSDELRRVVD